jgi:hypothetical protein
MKSTIGARILVSLVASCFSCCALADTEADVIKSMRYNPKIKLEHRLAAFDGVLLGFDGGEWGGALIFLDKHGRATEVVKDNIRGIVLADRRVLVFSGLAHLGSTRGKISELSQTANAPPIAHEVLDLHGEPSSVKKVSEQAVAFRVFSRIDQAGKMASVCKLYAQGLVSDWDGCEIEADEAREANGASVSHVW